MELFDTHCHLDVEEFAADRMAVLARARAAGVSRLVIPGVQASTWGKLLAFCATDEHLYPALGLHPVYLDVHRDADLLELERLIGLQRPIAVGEIGLDYFVSELDRKQQRELFSRQLAIARAANLPVLLHVRKAHDDTLALLRQTKLRGGICHAFNGSLQQAHQYLELGFKLGFGGMLTYERSQKIRRLATELPIEDIVLETDAPDMTVASHHGERNSPEYLPECLAALAELRQQDVAELASKTTANALEVLGISA